MTKQEITDKFYKEAVKGLNEIILQDKDLWYSYIIHLPKHLQVTYNTIVFHQQVFNGGLHQYFFNSFGQFAYLTVENLKLINAFQTATILEKAIDRVNIGQFSKDEFREKVFYRKLEHITNFDEVLCNYLDELDNEYYSVEEDIEELLVNYIRSADTKL